MYGQSGIDRFFAKDDEIDHVFGGGDADIAEVDPTDLLASVETTT